MSDLDLEFKKMSGKFEDYLKDESRFKGDAESICFPKNVKQIIAGIDYAKKNNQNITIQGSRTGVCAGAVPASGHIINLTKMNKVLGLRYKEENNTFFLDVEAGISLENLNALLSRKDFDTKKWDKKSLKNFKKFKKRRKMFFSCNPTENTATLGAMVATNAAGPLTYKYGQMSEHVDFLEIVLANSDILKIKRGENIIKNNKCQLETMDNKIIDINFNDSDGGIENGKDIIDLFMPSEGIFGIITKIGIKIIPKPNVIWGVLSFFKKEEEVFNFISKFKNQPFSENDIEIAELEFFDNKSLRLIKKLKKKATLLKTLPDFDENSAAAVYIRLQGENESKMEESLETMLAWLHETGADLDKVWAVNQSDELEKMRIFRHSAPESINDMLDNYRSEERSIYKVSTDIQLSKVSPEEVFKIYKDELANFNLTGVSFGHLLLGHLHINIIPQNIEEHKKAEEFIENLTKIIAKKGGTICQEHGIGKLRKKQIQKDIYKNWLSNMESIKSVLDPKRIMGVDNILLSEGE